MPQARIRSIGKLRKGGVKTPKRFGADLDHFRFDGEPEVAKAFQAAYGNAPVLINGYLPYEKAEDCFPVYAEIWTASGITHKCDGVTQFVWRSGPQIIRGERPCNKTEHKNGNPDNDMVGRLSFIVPELMPAHMGVITVETHSKNDIATIRQALQAFTEMSKQLFPDRGGSLVGFPFQILRQPEEISVPGFGDNASGRSKATKWLIKLQPMPQVLESLSKMFG
jgi:hypothetical protein